MGIFDLATNIAQEIIVNNLVRDTDFGELVQIIEQELNSYNIVIEDNEFNDKE